MTYFIVAETNEGNTPSIDVEICKKNKVSIFVSGKHLDEIGDILRSAEADILESCQNWTENKEPDHIEIMGAGTGKDPETEEGEISEHYTVNERSDEEMDRNAASYENTPGGQRFIKSIENARKYLANNGKIGIFADQLYYLANKYHNNLINGCYDIMALVYRQAYKKGLEEGLKKARKKGQ